MIDRTLIVTSNIDLKNKNIYFNLPTENVTYLPLLNMYILRYYLLPTNNPTAIPYAINNHDMTYNSYIIRFLNQHTHNVALNFTSDCEVSLPPTFNLRRYQPMAIRPTPTQISWCLNQLGIDSKTPFTGKGVSIAVLDTGIDDLHPDFKDRVSKDNKKSFVGGTYMDGHGHGTHCAGIAAGPAHPKCGIRYGVAPESTLIIGKVLADSGSGTLSGIIEGIEWAASRGAKIISMSLGSPRVSGEKYIEIYEKVAEQLSKQGVLLVAAAGNESDRRVGRRSCVGNPAACPSIEAVAATDRKAEVAFFSSAEIDDIGQLGGSAPGVDVLSTFAGKGRALYVTMSGTSMSCPHMAGVYALYRERFPDHSVDSLITTVHHRMKKLGDRSDYGHGMAYVS